MLIPKPVRMRSKEHLARVRTLRCCVHGCAGWPVEVHHLTHAQPKARGLKSGDQWCVSLCAAHHNPTSHGSVHHAGDERAWWGSLGIDPMAIAERLWNESERLRSEKNNPGCWVEGENPSRKSALTPG